MTKKKKNDEEKSQPESFSQRLLGLWVVEYSQLEGQFRVHTVREMLEANIRAFRQDTETEGHYVPLGFFNERPQADAFADGLKAAKGEG